MSVLLVLCGDGRMMNDRPLITMRHPDGKLVAEKAIEGIFPDTYDKIFYVITEDAEEKYRVGIEIREILGSRYPVEIIKLKEKTSGPAETVYSALQISGVQGEITIRDCNNFISLPQESRGNYIAGLDISRYAHTVDNLRSKSFVLRNEQQQVLDIVEKHFCSDVISCGLYGFERTSDFIEAYERLNNSHYPIKKLYISHIISYLIGYSGRVFHVVDVTAFEDWKTQHAWAATQRRHGVYFLDMDKLDVNNEHVDESVLKMLQSLSRSGGRFVMYFREELDESEMLAYLNGKGIHVLSVVAGCGYSDVCKIVNNRKKLEQIVSEDI